MISPVVWVRRKLNRLGWDVCRHRPSLELLETYKFEVVLDVGANAGQHAEELRRHGYTGKIISFEPQRNVFDELRQKTKQDGRWEARQIALGKTEHEAEFNVYEDTRYSSFKNLNKDDTVVRKEKIRIKRLDSIFEECVDGAQRVFLKIDTQGFEREVLEGAQGCLERIDGIQVEASLTPIYDEQMKMEESLRLLRDLGFVPWVLRRGYFKGLREFEYDILAFRPQVGLSFPDV